MTITLITHNKLERGDWPLELLRLKQTTCNCQVVMGIKATTIKIIMKVGNVFAFIKRSIIMKEGFRM
jgi:hypothetical protein